MTLVDSSAWIEFFRRTGSPAHLRLRALVESGADLLTVGPVAMELLAGNDRPGEASRVAAALASCRRIIVDESGDWEAAADIHLACRRRGVTPRKLLDCLIAAIAIRSEVPVLAQDRDFALIAEHTPLRLA